MKETEMECGREKEKRDHLRGRLMMRCICLCHRFLCVSVSLCICVCMCVMNYVQRGHCEVLGGAAALR